MSLKHETAGGYEILASMQLGGREILLGEKLDEPEAAYMTCYRTHEFFGVDFPEATASADFLENAEIFVRRAAAQISEVKAFRAARGVPMRLLTKSHCRERAPNENLTGKLVILRPTSLAPEYRTADCQLGIAVGGFGCQPGPDGRAVYFRELFSGETSRWNSSDILGIADPAKLPKWAKAKWKKYQKQRRKKQKKGRC